MKVPLLDLRPQNEPLQPQIEEALKGVIGSGRFILGPVVSEFEAELAKYLQVEQALGVSSGTDALLIALMGLNIGPGDEVVTTPYSFFATAGCITRLGAKPVFADIETTSFNLDPRAAEAACNSKTRAVIPVHLYGRPASNPNVDAPVVEDAAQSIGAPLEGAVGCLSFFPSKNLGAFGDGGAVYTNDADLFDRMKVLRVHGGRPKYVHQMIGGNFRLDALQAAVLQVKLEHLSDWTAQRRANADRYREIFPTTAGIPDELVLPNDVPTHIYNQFVVRVPRRDELRAYLTEQGIGTEVYYPVPFHVQPCFKDLGYKEGSFPVSEAAARETLALPVYPGISAEQQQYVAERIAAFYAG